MKVAEKIDLPPVFVPFDKLESGAYFPSNRKPKRFKGHSLCAPVPKIVFNKLALSYFQKHIFFT